MSTELHGVERGAPTPPAPWFAPDKLALLPDAGGDVDPYWRLAAAFLVGYPPHSSRAYFGDLRGWYSWCAESGVHPLSARRHHVDAWIRHLSQTPQPTTGRPASPASIARKLSCLSKFYDYGIKDVELFEHSPVANVRRPKISEDSPTIGLTAEGLDRLLTAAEAHGPRSAALVSLLVYNGVRIGEVLACDIDALTHQRGHRVLRVVRKGGKASTEPLAPIVLRALENYIGERTSGAIFAERRRHRATELLNELRTHPPARPPRRHGGAERISPHSLRHSFATELLAAGVPLQDVQDAIAHADPRTTRAYDRSRHNLDRHPTYKMPANLHRSTSGQPAAHSEKAEPTLPTSAAR